MKFLVLTLIALALAGCASTGEVSQVREDVNSVYSDIQKNDSRIAQMEKDLKELQKAVGSPDAGIRRQVADLSVSADSRDEKIRIILGRIDELETQLRTYWDEVKGEMKEMRRGKEPGGMTVAAPLPFKNNGAAPKGTADDLYKRGFDAFQKGAYEDAVATFAQYVQQNPAAPLTPNAYYWMGEGYMKMKAQEKAIVQFLEVIDKFPKSEKAARAMLRQAECFATLNDKKSSTTLLKRGVELFPKTEEARLADRMLRGGTLLQ
jgi:tol-pal system protein YbgF